MTVHPVAPLRSAPALHESAWQELRFREQGLALVTEASVMPADRSLALPAMLMENHSS